jgi:hypothetical protein
MTVIEGFLCHLVAVIVRPSPYDRVQEFNHVFLLCLFVSLDNRSDFPQERLHVLFRRLDEKLLTVFANVPPKEIKTLFDMCQVPDDCVEFL